jgi:hypothetical protein
LERTWVTFQQVRRLRLNAFRAQPGKEEAPPAYVASTKTRATATATTILQLDYSAMTCKRRAGTRRSRQRQILLQQTTRSKPDNLRRARATVEATTILHVLDYRLITTTKLSQRNESLQIILLEMSPFSAEYPPPSCEI